jgi:RsiW-degrading membrane proteinase PrsW (M82 family)
MSPGRAAGAAAAVAVLLALLAQAAVETPPVLFAAALAPALLCVAALLALGGGARRPRRLLAAAFLWGATAAPLLAAALNVALRAELGGAAAWAPVLGAPFVEEAAKALALLLVLAVHRPAIATAADGVVFGALIGIGFTMAENLFYFAAAALTRGPAGLAESVYLRAALGGFIHATFTASTGAGVGWGRAQRGAARLAAPLLGFLLAVAQHAAWNGVGAPWLDGAACAPRASAACDASGRLWYWLATAPAIVALFIGPGLAAALWLARRGAAPAGRPRLARH